MSRSTAAVWLRRPLVLTVACALLLAALLSGGLVAARAVNGTPASTESSGSASGNSSGGDNVAGAVNTQDGKTVYAIKLKILQTSADTVDTTNAAIAVNSGCTGCSTVAIAFEAVIVVGSPSTFTPTNLAIAYNENCSGCTAFASAYQQVVQTSTRVRITKEGRMQVAAIRKDLKEIKKLDLTLDEIRARVAAAEEAFAAVLRNEIVPVGNVKEPAPADARDIGDDPEESVEPTDATASPSADPSAPVTDLSASPSAEPTADASPSTAPTSEASASPSPSTS